jgi:hypothetical protein
LVAAFSAVASTRSGYDTCALGTGDDFGEAGEASPDDANRSSRPALQAARSSSVNLHDHDHKVLLEYYSSASIGTWKES